MAVAFSDDFFGLDTPWSYAAGCAPRHYLDSAASTLAQGRGVRARAQLLEHYASPHSSGNTASELCVAAQQLAEREILAFWGFSQADYYCFFLGSGASAPLNRAAQILSRLAPGKRAVLSLLEHHSNDLPHRAHMKKVVHLFDADGQFDLAGLEQALQRGAVGYVALGACSNVTGALAPIEQAAQLCRAYAVPILLDASQLAVHRRLECANALDALVFCGHKAYAPGTPGVLIIRRALHEAAGPCEWGGGMIEQVTFNQWTLAAGRAAFQAGTPDVLGAFQLAKVLSALRKEGFNTLIEHERALGQSLHKGLQQLPGITLYGDWANTSAAVVSFNLAGFHHEALAGLLAWQFNITVRSGCFCAQPLVRHLLGLGSELLPASGPLPGMVRVSLAAYTKPHDIAALLNALARLADAPSYYQKLWAEQGKTWIAQQARERLAHLWE